MTSAISERKQQRARLLGRDTEINVVSLIDIFAILVFYLLVNALVVEVIPRYQDLTLPDAAAQQKPEEAVVLAVNHDSIFIDDRPLLARQNLPGDAGTVIAPLVVALRGELAERASLSPVAEADEAGGVINIVADREIPYALLKRILASCAEAGFSQVLLTVEPRRGRS